MHLVQAYVGFDCNLPLCISFWNLEFAYLPHPFVKYLPSPLKKTVLEHLFEFHFTNSVKGSPQISPMTDSFSCGAQLQYNQVYKSFPFLLMFLQILSISITQSKRRRKKKKKEKEYELSLSQYQGPTCHIENLISAEESKASTCQIHVFLADRSKIRVTITKLFF